MQLSRIAFTLPLVTALITVLNSSAFVFLATDERLAQYLAGSSIFSLFVWFSNWITPSIFSFEEKKIREIRLVQFLLALAGVVILNALIPSTISLAFSVLLVVEIFFFHYGVLLIHSRTYVFHLIEFCRSILNLGNILLCLFWFDGSPTSLVWGLTANMILIGVISFRSGNCAPSASAAAFSWRMLSSTVRTAASSQNTRFMFIARALEIVVILALSQLEALSIIVAVKLAVMVAQALSLNARNVSNAFILGFSAALVAITLGVLAQVNLTWPTILPGALKLISWSDLMVALLFQVPFTWLLCKSLGTQRH